MELQNTLKNIKISQDYFNAKNKYLYDFKHYISVYNAGNGTSSILSEINERAEKINTYLINETEQETPIRQSSELQTEDIYGAVEKLLYLQKEQEELEKQNKIFFKKYSEINNIFDEIKSKNAAYSQIIDEDSNQRIQKYYEEIYDEEIHIANKYRKWALWIFAAVGSFLLIGFLIVSIQNWNHLRNPSFIEIKLGWDSLFKTLMLFSLTTPGWYLTKESSKHRQVAYKAKMLGTELAAFPLYAREFKDEERLELRKNLADRFFGQELYGSSTPKADNSSSTEQIKLLAEMNKVTVEAIKVQQTLLGKKE